MKRYITIFFSIIFLGACSVQQPISSERFGVDVKKDVPFKMASMETVANHPGVYAFRCDGYVDRLPDYEVDAEGAMMVYKTTFMPTHDKQPANVIWRNIIVNKSDKRVLCIDRLLKDGKTFGYIYVLQSETKAYSDENTYHFDVSDHRLMLNVSGAIEHMTELSVTTLNTLLK